MKANRRARRDDEAGAETIGAIILFGIFVTTIALLNITAVPQAGLAAEEEHVRVVLDALNKLETDAEAAGGPGSVGATVGASLQLAPARDVGQDFFSFFLAQPALATGQLTFVQGYGNLTLTHHKQGNPAQIVDIGSPVAGFPFGRLQFDPHANFRSPGVFQLENGGLVSTEETSGTESMRFSPPITLDTAAGQTTVAVKARVLNGTDVDVGGTTTVRVGLVTEAATLVTPASPNAKNLTLRMETSHGRAWGAFLNRTAEDGGLAAWNGVLEEGYGTTVEIGAAPGGLDVVTWRVFGPSSAASNDIALGYGVAVYGVTLS